MVSEIHCAGLTSWELSPQLNRKEFEVVVLSVFGDESHDEKAERIFVVAAIAGTREEWEYLIPLWHERTQGIPFHGNTVQEASVQINSDDVF